MRMLSRTRIGSPRPGAIKPIEARTATEGAAGLMRAGHACEGRLLEKLFIDMSVGADSRHRSTPSAAIDLPFK